MSVLRRTVRVLKLGAAAGVIAGIIRAIRGSRPQAVTGRASWPPIADPPAPQTRTGPVRFADAGPEAAWVPPVDGVCPATHPIKGNEQSGIFHVPGGLSYDRTVPERCYASPEAAEADGFRKAKR